VPYADFHDPQSLNLYGFVGGNPASKADPDGHEGPGSYEGMVAMANSIGDRFGEDFDKIKNAIKNAMGPDLPHGETPGLENMKQRLQQCPCPSNQTQENSKQNNNNSNSQNTNGGKDGSSTKNGMAPKKGETGGPGAGKEFNDKTKGQAVEENKAANNGDAKCVFCNDKVGKGTDNKMNIDHAKAQSENGNNSLNNANVTCEYCNKSKGTGDAPKNPKYKDQN
jgi:hypothetical protein